MVGLNLRELTAQEKKKYEVDIGLKVVGRVTGNLREETNMCEDFIITAINGKPVASLEEFEDMIDGEKGVMLEGFYPDGTPDHYFTKSLAG
ncbi:MAG: hypothetical protein ACR2MX_11920 [Cyclobacteriaceae bacterium]